MSMRKISSDTVIALLLLVICGVFFYETFHFRRTPLSIVPSSLWPRIVIITLALFSFAYLISSLRADRSEGDADTVGIRHWIFRNQNVLWCFGLFTIYVVTLPFLGMLLGSIAFVFAALTAMGRNKLQSHVLNLFISIISVGGMWSVFTFGLNVMLPEGRILRVF